MLVLAAAAALVAAVTYNVTQDFKHSVHETKQQLRTLSAARPTTRPAGTVYAEGDRLFAACGDGRALPIVSLEVEGNSLDAAAFRKLLGDEAFASEPGRS